MSAVGHTAREAAWQANAPPELGGGRGYREPEAQAEVRVAVLVPAVSGGRLLTRPERHREHLAGDHLLVRGERGGKLCVRGGPAQLDPVGDVEAVVLPRVL